MSPFPTFESKIKKNIEMPVLVTSFDKNALKNELELKLETFGN